MDKLKIRQNGLEEEVNTLKATNVNTQAEMNQLKKENTELKVGKKMKEELKQQN